MIFRLALQQIRSHKIRSSLIALAVVLTSVLFMTVMSIAYCIMDSYQLSLMLATGSDFHAQIGDSGYSLTGEELLHEIKSAPEVSEAFLMGVTYHPVPDTEYLGEEATVIFTDSKQILPHLFMTVTEGRFPEQESEILLSEGLFPLLDVGDTITFTYSSYSEETAKYEEVDQTYTVSGLYRCDADAAIPAVALYSEEIAGELGLSMDIMVSFHSSFGLQERLNLVTGRLAEYEVSGVMTSGMVNGAYVAADLGEIFRPANILMFVFVVAVVFFAAFLLIYNIYAIGLTQDMQTFGLLWVVGMTHRQMKRLTYVQTTFIGAVSLPVGLAAGYLIGFRLLSPVFMSMSGDVLPYRFSPWILFLSFILTVFTLFFSALRPLKRIKKLTPVQAVSGDIISEKNDKERPIQITASPFRLAMAGIRRSHGRAVITSLSAMLSVLLFVILGGLVDYVMEYTYRTAGRFDINLSLVYDEIIEQFETGAMQTLTLYNTCDASIDKEIFEDVVALDSVDELYALRFQRIRANASPRLMEKISEFLAQQEEESLDMDTVMIDAANGVLTDAVIMGIPDELCQYLRVGRNADGTARFYDGEELYDGNHVLSVFTEKIWGANYLDLHLFDGDLLESDSLSSKYEVLPIELPADGYGILWEVCRYSYIKGDTALFLMPMSVFEKEFPDAPVFTVLANAKEGREEELRTAIDELTDSKIVEYEDISYYYRTSGRLDDLEKLGSRLFALRLTGYSLSGIIFFIGVLNMINSALTSMLLRRREFAMLETVGMTRLQLRQMLLYENSVGGVFGMISLVIGSLLSGTVLTAAFGMEISILSLPAVGIMLLLLVVGAVTAEISYRFLAGTSLTERMK